MRETKRCPKCYSSDIMRVEGNVGAYGSGSNIQLGVSVFSCVPVARFICGRCGFTEEWVDTKELPKLRKSKKVTFL